MTFSGRLRAALIISCLLYGIVAAAQPNLIVNGNFISDSGWNDLGLYNDGTAESTVEGNAYMIAIENPGTELWSVQLTQSDITLQNGSAYILSFEVSASVERTIEVTISRNGGDWISYSGKDTIAISPTRLLIEMQFIMKEATDEAARLEFNCGKAGGTVAVRNVQLTKFTEKVLELETPKPGELVFAGVPYQIVWSTVNISAQLTVQFSDNNGTSWTVLDTVDPGSSPYQWTPDRVYTPWCQLRLVSTDSPSVNATLPGSFEIVPVNELLKNGSFTNADTLWNLGVHSGSVEKEITAYGGYQITVFESGTEDWNVQLTQDNVVLETGKRYRYSFLGFSDSSSTIDVNIGMSGDPYESYIDSGSRFVSLTPVPTRYSFTFDMNAPPDSNARFEVNCGKAMGQLFFDDFSIIQEYVAPVQKHFMSEENQLVVVPAANCCTGKILHLRNVYGRSGSNYPKRVFDLKGRLLKRSKFQKSPQNMQVPFGVYIKESLERDNYPTK